MRVFLSACAASHISSQPLLITITATKINAASLLGAGNLVLSGVDTPEIKLDVVGSGDIHTSGKASQVDVTLLV